MSKVKKLPLKSEAPVSVPPAVPIHSLPHSEVKSALELLTPEELAARLKVPLSWIYNHNRKGVRDRIPVYKVGHHLRFNWTEVSSWLEEHHEKAA
jgi:excisionase family DNA binding protein